MLCFFLGIGLSQNLSTCMNAEFYEVKSKFKDELKCCFLLFTGIHNIAVHNVRQGQGAINFLTRVKTICIKVLHIHTYIIYFSYELREILRFKPVFLRLNSIFYHS